MKKNCLLVFTRYPEEGKTKTRLIPHLGAKGAAEIHKKLTRQILQEVCSFADAYGNINIEIYFTGASSQKMQGWLGKKWRLIPQVKGDLGERLEHTFSKTFSNRAGKVVTIGTDCPFLTQDHFKQAFDALNRFSLVVGPASDGGYYLIGMREPMSFLFENISWGTSKVLQQTLQTAKRNMKSWIELETLSDIDRPEDLSKLPKQLLGNRFG